MASLFFSYFLSIKPICIEKIEVREEGEEENEEKEGNEAEFEEEDGEQREWREEEYIEGKGIKETKKKIWKEERGKH